MSTIKRKRTADVRVPRASRPAKTVVDDRLKTLAKTCRKTRRDLIEADRLAWRPDDLGPLEETAIAKVRRATNLLGDAAELLDDLAVRPRI